MSSAMARMFIPACVRIITNPSTAITPPRMRSVVTWWIVTMLWAIVKVRFPMALPFFFSGLKVAITLAVIGAVVGEFIGSDKGLGYVILSATSYWKTGLAFASMILLSVIAIVLFGAVCLVERLVCPWLAPAAEE